MQISDIPSDLEPPTAAFLPVLSLVLAEDASSRPLPTEMVASSLLMRHRFLNLTPEDSRYFQSRTDQDLSNALESLRGLAGQWQLSAWSWRASPSEVGGISLFTKVVVSPEDPRLAASMDGVGLVLSLEPAATALNPTTAPEEDVREPVSSWTLSCFLTLAFPSNGRSNGSTMMQYHPSPLSPGSMLWRKLSMTSHQNTATLKPLVKD